MGIYDKYIVIDKRLINKYWNLLKSTNGGANLYGFKYSFATLCSERGVLGTVLKELMGYSASSTTNKYYIHVTLTRKIEEINKIWG